jgi:type I restriction enzyme S subunit
MGRLIPIGKLFNLEKGELQSTKCTPGKYNFITAAEDWKTHNEYDHECEALIIAVAASGSLGRTHYVDGKFISSDLCFILTPKNESKYPINLAFYHFVFNSLRPVLVAATKSGTSKESINQTNLKKYELPYFDIEQQDLWIEKLKNTRCAPWRAKRRRVVPGRRRHGRMGGVTKGRRSRS